VLASAAAFVWGMYNLIGTGSCGTATTQACSSETGQHIIAVVLGPFVGFAGGTLLALRGGTSLRWGPRRKRVADMVARGEMPEPTVARPATPAPVLPDGPPATWKPNFPESAEAETSPIERLNQLDRMKEKGLISVADYESQKKRILGGI